VTLCEHGPFCGACIRRLLWAQVRPRARCSRVCMQMHQSASLPCAPDASPALRRQLTQPPAQQTPHLTQTRGAHHAQGGACPCPLCREGLTPAALFDEAALRGERTAAQQFPVFPEPMPMSRKFEATLEMLNSAIRCALG